MYCQQCGLELPERSKFCNECGAKQEAVIKKGDVIETTHFTHIGHMCEGEIHGFNIFKNMKRGTILLTNHKLSFDGFDIPISDIKSVREYIRRQMNAKTTVMIVHTKDRRIYKYIVTSKKLKSLALNSKTKDLIDILSGMA